MREDGASEKQMLHRTMPASLCDQQTITDYQVMPGIKVRFNDVPVCERGIEPGACANAVELHYCCKGRLEAELKNGVGIYLGPGDLCIRYCDTKIEQTDHLLEQYQGVTVLLLPEKAMPHIQELAQKLLGISIDLTAFIEWLSRDACPVLRKFPMVQYIFEGMCQLRCSSNSFGFYKLKMLELFFFLSGYDFSSWNQPASYIRQDQIDRMQEIREYLIENLDQKVSLSAISMKFHISLTTLKACFKSVYGKTLNAYVREYRLHVAEKLLLETELEIAEIAQKVGYESPSRFSAVFKQYKTQTPRDFRRFGRLYAGRKGKDLNECKNL